MVRVRFSYVAKIREVPCRGPYVMLCGGLAALTRSAWRPPCMRAVITPLSSIQRFTVRSEQTNDVGVVCTPADTRCCRPQGFRRRLSALGKPATECTIWLFEVIRQASLLLQGSDNCFFWLRRWRVPWTSRMSGALGIEARLRGRGHCRHPDLAARLIAATSRLFPGYITSAP
jgi:hypothetical protein